MVGLREIFSYFIKNLTRLTEQKKNDPIKSVSEPENVKIVKIKAV